MGLGEIISGCVEMLRAIWDYIKKKFFIPLLKFFSNIVSFFKDPDRLRKLENDNELLAVSIKDKLDSGGYNVINCLFDKSINKIVDYNKDAQGITTNRLDSETEAMFGDKDMLILE